MPHRSTGMLRLASAARIASSARRVTAGSRPRSASLAPSSRITASVPSGTDQSRRASPPDIVSPETPALATLTAMPLAASACCSLAGNASWFRSPYPAVSESPSATMLSCLSAAAAGPVHTASAHARATTMPRQAIPARMLSISHERIAPHQRHLAAVPRWNCNSRMNDTSTNSASVSAVALAGVNLSLGNGAARVHILKDITLNIGRGEAVGLVGPSGSGKSTLLMVMAGLERADTGSVVVAGEDIGRLDEDALARFRGRQVGIVFQSFHLIPTMTAIENVAVPLELAGVADAFARAAGELQAVGLGDRLHHY